MIRGRVLLIKELGAPWHPLSCLLVGGMTEWKRKWKLLFMMLMEKNMEKPRMGHIGFRV